MPMNSMTFMDKEALKGLVPSRVNEVEILARFEMLVHNLQSSFDTYGHPRRVPLWEP